MKTPLLGKTLNELKEIVISLNLPSFTAKQITEWLYKKRIFDVEQMTNISVKNRAIIGEHFCIGTTAPVQVMESSDGTKKYLFKVSKGYIESVYIPEEDRATLCISSQVGCKINCLFCMTGKQGFSGNLSVAEILNQIVSIPEADKLTNIVFMGMGEPFDNTIEVLKALEILTSDHAYAWSPKRITVSTIGLIPGMKIFLEKSNCHLAVSLHNPFHEERLQLMPSEKAYSIQEIVDLLKKYDFSHQRRISFEYIMFKGGNDTIRHAKELVYLLSGLECRINLIRFHEIPGVNLQTSEDEKIIRFRDYLSANGITTTIRKSRGEDILAACGMLSTQQKINHSN